MRFLISSFIVVSTSTDPGEPKFDKNDIRSVPVGRSRDRAKHVAISDDVLAGSRALFEEAQIKRGDSLLVADLIKQVRDAITQWERQSQTQGKLFPATVAQGKFKVALSDIVGGNKDVAREVKANLDEETRRRITALQWKVREEGRVFGNSGYWDAGTVVLPNGKIHWFHNDLEVMNSYGLRSSCSLFLKKEPQKTLRSAYYTQETMPICLYENLEQHPRKFKGSVRVDLYYDGSADVLCGDLGTFRGPKDKIFEALHVSGPYPRMPNYALLPWDSVVRQIFNGEQHDSRYRYDREAAKKLCSKFEEAQQFFIRVRDSVGSANVIEMPPKLIPNEKLVNEFLD
jgi:hypothetical protein